MNCRYCTNELTHEFADLGFSPPSNSFLSKQQLNEPEVYYPLKTLVCEKCFLVQIDEFAKHDDIFNSDYAYFSSFSTSWLAHAKAYTEMMTARFGFDKDSQVIEIASNDGYLLQYFKEQGIPVLGIEPTKNTADAAKEKGIDSVVDFFGVRLATSLAAKGIKADLLLGNNVLAHVPDINDFAGGLKILLKDKGVITFEFPHLLQLIDKNQFDTIYHEHFSYLSLIAVKQIFETAGLELFDVEELPTHGGSLRIFAKHAEDAQKIVSDNVANMLQKEKDFGLADLDIYLSYQEKAEKVKNDFTRFLIDARNDGKKVAGYGAAAKGNTLLNFAGIKKDLLEFVTDASPHKQNKYLPGVHIPVFSEQKIKDERPDYVVILPWNLREEITSQLAYIQEWGGKFVVAVPALEII
ncbi:class I SAM-dependent methyltransferase [Ferruginibacter sp. HRS2-29]|uniref:class I SAM-dependent methyltransferase n=1 Tax=Ferruginibacter sp. HRS2-29 TaxID=2487334 RepID=UPI0020CE01F6|nr:class I SAM-dependent methyltransferase [Ferruginibacter sp. HRS2-29]MCP9749909.1 class I SAM-dependent methyltransferase [Ferruginibacter sp. HRS2-29]